MDKCFNCGAAVRSGAKFCTSCGTRLIDNSAATTSETPEGAAWGQAASADETQIATPAATPEPSVEASATPDDSSPFATWRSANSSWSASASPEPSAGASPADRFEAALDRSSTSTDEDANSWGQPAPTTDERFASWSAAYGANAEAEEPVSTGTESGNGIDSDEVVAVESATIADDTTLPDTGSTGWSGSDAHDDDSSVTEEQVTGVAASEGSGDQEFRQRATTLIEELRELVWKIGEQEPASTGDLTEVRNALSDARGHTGDFSDLERMIATVRERPRDIDALVQLGGNAARLEELLESHHRLTSVLDDAISKLQ